MKRNILALILILALTLVAGCGSQTSETGAEADKGAQTETGTLEFRANGEDFVRQGFVSMDGWNITFDNVYVTLAEITAYQTDPPYDPDSHTAIDSDNKVALSGNFTVDLAEGDENAETILVGTVDAAPGQYNALSWEMVKGSEGESKDNVVVIIGKATKDEQKIDFNIKFDKGYKYSSGEYVGDERKGILEAGGEADLEMTFHFDHIFGDAETPMDEGVNPGALGFDPFAALSQDGQISADMGKIEAEFSAEDFQKLLEILPTLGHVGEGHAFAEEI